MTVPRRKMALKSFPDGKEEYRETLLCMGSETRVRHNWREAKNLGTLGLWD